MAVKSKYGRCDINLLVSCPTHPAFCFGVGMCPVPRLLALHEVQLLLAGWSCPVSEDTFSVPCLFKSHIQSLVHNALPSRYLQGIGSRMIESESHALFTTISANQDLYLNHVSSFREFRPACLRSLFCLPKPPRNPLASYSQRFLGAGVQGSRRRRA